MPAVPGFHPLIKFLRTDINQHPEQRTEQNRIHIKDFPNNNRSIINFSNINKTDHPHRKQQQQKITPTKMPVSFIKNIMDQYPSKVNNAPAHKPTIESSTPIFRATLREAPIATVQTAQAGFAKALTGNAAAITIINKKLFIYHLQYI